MRWKKWWRRASDGNMDACRLHGHIPSLLVLFRDRFCLVCRLPVEDTELPVEGTELPLSLSWAILLTYTVLLATCNYSIEIRFIFFSFFFFFFLSFFLKTTTAPHGGFHPNCLPWVPPREVFTQRSYSLFIFSSFQPIDCLMEVFNQWANLRHLRGGFHLRFLFPSYFHFFSFFFYPTLLEKQNSFQV